MNSHLRLLLLIGIFVLAAPAEEADAKKTMRCPNGHTTLKEVPLLYGDPAPDDSEVERRTQAEARLEFLYSGPPHGPDDPKHTTACTTCKAIRLPLMDGDPDKQSWMLQSSDPMDPNAFPQPISERLRSFPRPRASELKQPICYTKTVVSSQLNIQDESLIFRTTRNLKELKMEIDAWCRADKSGTVEFKSDSVVRPRGEGAMETFTWSNIDSMLTVFLRFDPVSLTSEVLVSSTQVVRPRTGGQ